MLVNLTAAGKILIATLVLICMLHAALLDTGSARGADYPADTGNRESTTVIPDSLTHGTARAYHSIGWFSMSKEALLHSLDKLAAQGQNETAEYAYLLYDLGNIYIVRNEYAIANDFFKKAVSILSKSSESKRNTKYIQLKLRWAYTETRLDNPLSAIIIYFQIRTIYEDSLGVNHPETIGIVLKIAAVYTEINSFRKASSLYDEVEGLVSQNPENTNIVYTHLLLDKATYFEVSGKLDQAIKSQYQALESILQNGGNDNAQYATAQTYLAELLLKYDQNSDISEILDKTVSLNLKALGKHHLIYLQSKKLLANYYWSQGKYKESEALYSDLIQEYLRQYEMFYPVMGVQEKTMLYQSIHAIIEIYANLTEQNPINGDVFSNSLLNYVLALKRLPLYTEDKFNDLTRSGLIKWKNTLEQLLHIYKLPVSELEGGSKYLKGLTGTCMEIEKKMLKQSGKSVSFLKIERPEYTEIIKSLKDLHGSLEIFRFRTYSPDQGGNFLDDIHYGFFISDNQLGKLPGMIVIKNGNDLENKFLTYYRSSINHRFPDDYSYTVYYEPLKTYLQSYSSIIIAPDGAYRQINLLTLRNPETGMYLMDEKNIQLVSCTAEILAVKNKKEATQRDQEVFIFSSARFRLQNDHSGEEEAIPEYKMLTSSETESGMYYMRNKIKEHIQWNELLYEDDVKQHEAGLLEELYKTSGFKTYSFYGDSAVETAVKNLHNPYTLHFTIHGYFMEDSEIKNNGYHDNQLLQSGLILSGSFDYLDGVTNGMDMQDGLLTANEIYNLKLKDTELVFLSACETGLGIVQNGQSIHLFQDAFLRAGARSVIMSMWTTEAEYELEFMNLFYYYWLFEKQTKREAFNKAQLTMKESYERSYYWGAFIFIGE
ncbi:MAG: CHAT domain-containing protein [Bacteroidetes bacterium]|nr:CHAT domain-containing protein [Bacteroidota bacterium]